MLETFGSVMLELGRTNPNFYIVDADLASSLRLLPFKEKFPNRFIEVGVAEANMAGIAAGLAKTGKTVFITSFACFSPGNNYHVLRQSICYNNASVVIVGSHAGLASTDLGATHQMTEDVALMSSLPNMQVFSPLDSQELAKILPVLALSKSPAYLRLYRGFSTNFFSPKSNFTIGSSHIVQKGSKITILGYGPILELAFKMVQHNPMWQGLLEIINISSLKPLDIRTILTSIAKTNRLIVLEDHQKNGGLGQMVSSLCLENNLHPSFVHLAIDNQFGQSAKTRYELWDHYGIGQSDLVSAIKKLLKF